MITIKYIKNTGLIIEAYDSSIDVKLENNEATIELNEESWVFATANGHNSVIDGITVKVELRSEEEIAKNELQARINEAKQFLDKTDKKVLPDYEFEDGDNSLEWYIEERSKARAFIRANEVI